MLRPAHTPRAQPFMVNKSTCELVRVCCMQVPFTLRSLKVAWSLKEDILSPDLRQSDLTVDLCGEPPIHFILACSPARVNENRNPFAREEVLYYNLWMCRASCAARR